MTEKAKYVRINGQQKPAYLTARAKVIRENGPDLTEGEIVEALAQAYTGNGENGSGGVPGICGLVNETAAECGDPVFSREELDAMDQHELRRLASDANSDDINGRSTKLKIIAYFSCPYHVNHDSVTE